MSNIEYINGLYRNNNDFMYKCQIFYMMLITNNVLINMYFILK